MNFQRTKDFLICIDSDGCAMNTMDMKHHQAFGPELVKILDLQDHSEAIVRYWNKVNLFSQSRAMNRFRGFFEVCRYIDKHIKFIDGLTEYEAYLAAGGKLSNEGIKEAYQKTGHAIFAIAEQWSINVNKVISLIPLDQRIPFPNVNESIEAAHIHADIAVVSSANKEAIEAEWKQAGLVDFVRGIFTQECGSKKQIIAALKQAGNYQNLNVLKIGDAPSDLIAANDNAVLFYPIVPGQEAESWRLFKDTYFPLFLAGNYKDCEDKLIENFYRQLE